MSFSLTVLHYADIKSFSSKPIPPAHPPSHHGLATVHRHFIYQRGLLSRGAALDLQPQEELRAALHQLLELRHRCVDQRLHDGGQLSVKARGRAHLVDKRPPLSNYFIRKERQRVDVMKFNIHSAGKVRLETLEVYVVYLPVQPETDANVACKDENTFFLSAAVVIYKVFEDSCRHQIFQIGI